MSSNKIGPCLKCNKAVYDSQNFVKCTECENFLHFWCSRLKTSFYKNSYVCSACYIKVKCLKCQKYIYKSQNKLECSDCKNIIHLRCSDISAKMFKKSPNAIFTCKYCQNYKCGKCDKAVFDHHHAICCDNLDCEMWYHLKCTRLSLECYMDLSKNAKDENWFCDKCIALPFSSLSDIEFQNCMSDHVFVLPPIIIISNKQCSVCPRKVTKPHKCMHCKSCNCLVHRKCSGLSLRDLNLLKPKDLKHWQCQVCMHHQFPFAEIEDEIVLKENFNSNFNCACKNNSTPAINREHATFTFTRSLYESDNQYGPDPENITDKTFDLKPDFNYYELHDFHKLIRKIKIKNNHFSLFHTNIQSLMHNFEELEQLLLDHELMFDVIALSESWNPKKKTLTFTPGILKGYHKYNGMAGHSTKGGVGFYTKDTIKIIERKELDISFCDDCNEFQGKWIEIINNNKKINTLVCVFYRHPKKTSNNKFNEKLSQCLELLRKEMKTKIIAGDFNYDILKIGKDKYIDEFIDIMFSNHLQPCITEPTRIVKGNKPSLVDNIFVNVVEKQIFSGNLLSKISDHMPSFVIIKDQIYNANKTKRTIRDFKKFKEEDFINDIRNINILPIIANNENDIDSIYDSFQDIVIKTIDKHAPYKVLTNKEIQWKNKPWITKGIQKSIIIKNNLYSKFKKTNDPFWYNRYKYYRNTIKSINRTSKKNYYQNYFQIHAQNSKKMWAGINEIISKQVKNPTNEIFLNEEGQVITNQKEVANKFNTYFVNVARSLLQKMGNRPNKFQDYLKNPNEHSMYLNEVNPDEIYEIIMKLNVKKSGDIYGITPKLIKIIAEPLAPILSLIFNKSFELGKFPQNMKTSKVIPIHKNDSKMLTSNYRPISLLPILSKIFEKIMYSRIMDFVKTQKILYPRQFGFQQKKSTELAIVDIQAKVIQAFENMETPCCIFLDFAKAFDTVNHSILINKLNYYGVRGNALKWFESYLSDRQQCVEVGHAKSDFQVITCGVPQGSVLGPLLFLLYINDINLCSPLLSFHLFADDTSIFFSHKNKTVLQNILNNELVKVSDWLYANKLSLNVKKSNVILFRPKNASCDKLIELSIDNEPLEEKIYTKYLGILIDHKLTWEYHTEHVNSKLIKSNAILAKARHYIPNKSLKNIFNAFIQPHIDYGNVAWGTCAQTHLQRVERNLNKSLRIINFKTSEDPVEPLYACSDILNITKNKIFSQAKFIWKLMYSHQPNIITELFTLHGAIRSFRDPLKLNIPLRRTTHGQNFLTYDGVKHWNQLPTEIRQIKTVKKFTKELKKLLCSS